LHGIDFLHGTTSLADDRRTPEAPPQAIPALEDAFLEPVRAGSANSGPYIVRE
jgi:hypothetical protein